MPRRPPAAARPPAFAGTFSDFSAYRAVNPENLRRAAALPSRSRPGGPSRRRARRDWPAGQEAV